MVGLVVTLGGLLFPALLEMTTTTARSSGTAQISTMESAVPT